MAVRPKAIGVTMESGTRYILVDPETGEIVDDAQGYGYKSIKNAYAAWAYSNGTPEKYKEIEVKKDKIRAWIKEHMSFIRLLEQYELEIKRGDWGTKQKFNADLINQTMKERGLKAEFTGYEIWKVYKGR